MISRARKLGLLTLLYFCQGLPGGFLAVALPVILLRSGADLKTVGFAGLLSLPWMLKVVWAPLVDRYGHRGFGERKSWLVPAQLGMVLVCLALAQVDPVAALPTVAILFVVLNTFAATQDIAVDGIAVDLLTDAELGPGNSAAVSGFKLGNLFGGGVLLAAIGWLGWRGDFYVMAGCILIVLTIVLVWREPQRAERPTASIGAVMRRLWTSLRGLGAAFVVFIVFAKFGETFGGSMVKPMLVRHGFSDAMIATIDVTAGGVATIAGAAVAGWVSFRRGWRPVLGVAAAGQGATLVAMGVSAYGTMTPLLFLPFSVAENAFGGAVGVAVFALAMGGRDKAVGASQFTALQVMYISGASLAYPLAGVVADAVGYRPVMIAGGLMALALAGLCVSWARRLQRGERAALQGT
ncbi:MAG: MFS transporter [Myxococcota bacterium]